MMDVIARAKKLRAVIEGLATSLDDVSALESQELFPRWDANGVSYNVGDRLRYGGVLYKVLLSHVSQSAWEPGKTPSLYVRVDDPSVEFPEWVQPTGAHDAYASGYKVSHNGKHWVSEMDANVYEPGVYGWTEVA